MKALAIAFAATLVLCSWGLGSFAEAAKEKFTRTKPHVNIGTIYKPTECSDEVPAASGTIGSLAAAGIILGYESTGSIARGCPTGPVVNAPPGND